jgi:hypothetical protein
MKLLDVEVDGVGAVVLTERIGGTSTCWIPFLACNCALILAAAAAVCTPVSHLSRDTLKQKDGICSPAAAVGSGAAEDLAEASAPGLRGSRLNGLR